ncbi:hypothetical protein WJX77_009506 [Trebouxia sp. C0004]
MAGKIWRTWEWLQFGFDKLEFIFVQPGISFARRALASDTSRPHNEFPVWFYGTAGLRYPPPSLRVTAFGITAWRIRHHSSQNSRGI